MPAGSAAVHIVTGDRFAGTTFNATTSTFTLASSANLTSMFAPNFIMTVLGTGTANDGYYQILSSTFTGGHTVVTVESYSTGTAYPGTVPFVSSGTGAVILFNAMGAGPVGLTWTSRTSPTVNEIAGLATTGAGITLAVDYVGNTYKSTDGGHTWSAVTAVPDGNVSGQLAFAGGTWIYSGGGTNPIHVDRSLNNGTSWTSINTGIPQNAGSSTIMTNGSGTWVVADNIVGAYTIIGDELETIPGNVLSGTFVAGESLTQASTGAIIGNVFRNISTGGPLLILDVNIFSPASPDGSNIWTGNTSAATFQPTGIPTFADFTPPETITQAVTGATAIIFLTSRGQLFVNGLSMTGTPDSSHLWTSVSGGIFAPTTVPTANYTVPMAYSTNDGVSWTTYDPFKGGVPSIAPSIWNGSEFVSIVLDNSPLFPILATSTDGITWTTTTVTNSSTLFTLEKFGSNYLAIDGGATSVVDSSSVAGLATTSGTSVPLSGGLSALVAKSTLAFTFDNVGGVANTSNGITWTAGTLNFNHSLITGQGVILNGVTAGLSSHLVAVGSSGVTFASTNGTTWVYHSSGQSNDLLGIASGLSVDVAVGGTSVYAGLTPTGTLLTSSNNTSWTANNQGSNPLLGVAFLNGSTFVAVGQGGTIYASTTPTGSWTSQTSGTVNDLYSVAGESSSSTFVVGNFGTILHSTSTPGTSMTWTPQSITHYQIDGFVTSSINGSVTSGVFDFSNTVTQAVTGATAQVFSDNVPYVPNAGPLIVITSSITGTPDATHIWTQTGSGATFTPTSTPSPTASFTSGETVTQANTGATALVIGTIPGNGPMILDATSVFGFPNSYDVWIGGTSGAQFSPDMLNLTQFPSSTSQLNSVYSHGGTTVAVGANSTIATTTDSGTTWTLQVNNGGGSPLVSVTYDTTNSLWVTGYQGAPQLITSPDGITWSVEPQGAIATNGSYNNTAAIGSSSAVFVGYSVAGDTSNVMLTTDETSYTNYTAGGAFTPGETITQAITGATATFLGVQTVPTFVNYLVVTTGSITGTPNAYNMWVGNTSGAVAMPVALPAGDYAFNAVYDSTNNSFIAVGINGSISTYP